LIASIPILGTVKDVLDVIPGIVPNLVNLPPGCQFAPRCRAMADYHLTICTEVEPQLLPIEAEHLSRCWLYQDHDGHTAPLKPVHQVDVK